MSATLTTTGSGSRAAGSQGVSEGSRGDPRAAHDVRGDGHRDEPAYDADGGVTEREADVVVVEHP